METIPKVFISYSWSSPEHEKKVVELANRLVGHGIDVVLDKWDLKEGQDKYSFMEQSVTSPDIDKVLIISDKVYSEKSNERKGGVGDETMIISPEIYGKVNQDKYIPIVFEKDINAQPYLPAYLKGRIYIDLCDECFETGYEQLIRNIYEKPLHKKPALGKTPEWIFSETVDFSQLRDAIRQVKEVQSGNEARLLSFTRQFQDRLIERLDDFKISKEQPVEPEIVMENIEKMQPLRDLYLDYLESLILQTSDINIIAELFQELYNNTIYHESSSIYEQDGFKFLIWEMFVCTIVLLLHYEKYESIRHLVERTYFLKRGYGAKVEPTDFTRFRPWIKTLEDTLKQKCEQRWYSLTANTLMSRERIPNFTKSKLVEADVLLSQLALIFTSSEWFPMTYVYNENSGEMWERLISRKHCEKTMVMYGASNLDGLKEIAQKYNMGGKGYSGAIESIPSIASSIEIEKIGSMP